MEAKCHQRRNFYSVAKPREASFSHWSRYEATRPEHTDHWSKIKTYQLMKLPTGHFISFCTPKASQVQRYSRSKVALPKNPGTLAHVGSPELGQYLNETVPSTGYWRPPSASQQQAGKRARVPSACSQRAKRGFRYWGSVQGTKPATPGQKVTMGSRGTFLGVGVSRL